MGRRIKRLFMVLAVVLALTGCQSSKLQEAEAKPETPQKKTETVKNDTGDEDEYIDADYVEEYYGSDETEDLSKYQAKTTTAKNDKKETAELDEYDTEPTPEGMPKPVEPDEETVDSETKYTCSLLVECSTILNNMEELTEGKEDLVPSDGVIYSKSKVTFHDGESVYDVLLREMQNNRIHMESDWTPMYNSAYVKGINNLYEFDCGRLSGRMFQVNGWYPNYGCSRYQVQDGDVIEWHYTCDLGADLGAPME